MRRIIALVALAVTLPLVAQAAPSSTPTLDRLVNHFDRMSPEQVARNMRRVNATGQLKLQIYGAFANLLHAKACQADQTIRLPNGSTCYQTLMGWQQTIQLLGGNQQAAMQHALYERGQMQVAQQCAQGKSSAASCNAYYQAMSNINRQQHETSMRIIHNMDPYSCTLGEYGCVPR
ncbi:MAG: hypothetical protein ACE366_04575 [Bradymonadia bacterium]